KDKDVIVYKMHGDIARPDEVIICKDDYERYAIKHPVFQNALEGDLVKKTFLFLGFSFTDPHLEYMLGHLRSLLKESKREHFAIMREVIRADFSSGTKGNKEYKYAKNRQQLQIEDLTRYSIQTLLIKDFKEIPEVLSEIKDYYYQKNIFVSGSAKVFGEFGEERLEKLCYDIGAEIINKGFNLVSGFGLNVGSNAIMGALNSIFSNEKQQIEKRLLLRPFPQTDLAGEALNEFQKKYREDMISKCGFALFVAGNKEGEEVAQGVMQEFEIAKKLRKIPIPIGSTGFASKKIWDEMEIKLGDFFPNSVSKKIFKNLNDSNKSNGEIIKTIFEIIDKVRN
ncbi:MAG TPA: SIR2 family protein, partial [Pyrinomonadaceae bacterium]